VTFYKYVAPPALGCGSQVRSVNPKGISSPRLRDPAVKILRERILDKFFPHTQSRRVSKSPIKWLDKPEEHDYPAARSYLNLIYDDRRARVLANALKSAPPIQFKAKDIFRATRLPLLDKTNSHVARDHSKIRAGESMSPILLVRDSINGHVIIADGYHRLCAVYSLDEDAIIPCRIV